MDANRKRIPATSARRSGNQKRFWRDPVTRAAGMSESCNNLAARKRTRGKT
jgi:hypothetical protein